MQYLHTMIRVRDLESALDFFVNKLGLVETRRKDHEKGRFTLVFLATAPGEPEIELTYNLGTGGTLLHRSKLRPPGVRRRRHLRGLPAPARPGRHHQSPPA